VLALSVWHGAVAALQLVVVELDLNVARLAAKLAEALRSCIYVWFNLVPYSHSSHSFTHLSLCYLVPLHHEAHRHCFNFSCVIRKKYFRAGRMAQSEWKCSVRGVRDTPVADYSVHGLHTTWRVAYRPPIAVSLFFLALSVSYLK